MNMGALKITLTNFCYKKNIHIIKFGENFIILYYQWSTNQTI